MIGGLSASAPLQVFAQSPNELWHVEGVILDGQTGRPVSGVRVQIQPDAGEAITDVDGRFAVAGTVAGNRLLVASKPRYLALRMEGRKVIGNSGIPLSLRPGQRYIDVYRIYPAPIVFGRVVDSHGEAVRNVSVTPLHYVFDDIGGRSPRALEAARTNDLGEFRFSNLEPGDYILRFEPPAEIGALYFPAYFPGAVNLSDARIFHVDVGTELQLSDTVLPPSHSHTLQIHVLLPSGQPTAGTYSVMLPGDDNVVRMGMFRPQEGSILLPSGSYNLTIRARPNGTAEVAARPELLRLSIDVTMPDRDSEIDIQLPEASIVTGKVYIEALGNRSSRMISGVQLRLLQEMEPFDSDNVSGPTESAISDGSNSSGELVFRNISPGTYRLAVRQMPPGMYIAAIRDSEGRDLIKDGLEVSAASKKVISVVVGEPTILVRGMATDSGGAKVPGAVVVLVPDDRSQQQFFFSTNSDANALFELSSAPGAYHLYAWSELDGPAYRNPEFMMKVATQGRPVLIKEESVAIDVVVDTDGPRRP